MATHPFLSDEWFAAVEVLAEEHGAETGSVVDIVIDVTVTDTPFGGERPLHISSRAGRGHWDIGHADDADVHLTTDYETAREIFVGGEPAQAMEAFLAGKVKVQGDMAKLMTSGSAALTGRGALHEAIRVITE